MSDSESPELNPGLGPNEIVSPDNLHTEPPFVRPVYQEEPEEVVEPDEEKVEVKVKKSTKKK